MKTIFIKKDQLKIKKLVFLSLYVLILSSSCRWHLLADEAGGWLSANNSSHRVGSFLHDSVDVSAVNVHIQHSIFPILILTIK